MRILNPILAPTTSPTANCTAPAKYSTCSEPSSLTWTPAQIITAVVVGIFLLLALRSVYKVFFKNNPK